MAYEAKGIYNDSEMSDADKQKIDALKQQYDYYKGQGNMDMANQMHQQAEQIRSGYGYSGGGDGSQYIPTGSTASSVIGTGVQFSNGYPATQLTGPTAKYDEIDAWTKAQQEQALAALKSAYDQNVIDVDATAAKIPEVYKAAREKTARDSAIQKANFNEYAAASGLNSGTGSQAELSRSIAEQNNLSSISQAEASALKDVETQRLKLKTQYQNAIAEAIANGELQRAQLLYQEAVRVDEGIVQTALNQADENYRAWQSQYMVQSDKNSFLQTMADNLAAYGDFSGYKALGYNDAQIAQMQAYFNQLKTAQTSSGESTTDKKWVPKNLYDKNELKPVDTGGRDLSAYALQLLSDLNRQGAGILDSVKKDALADAYERGDITEAELYMMMNALGLA